MNINYNRVLEAFLGEWLLKKDKERLKQGSTLNFVDWMRLEGYLKEEVPDAK